MIVKIFDNSMLSSIMVDIVLKVCKMIDGFNSYSFERSVKEIAMSTEHFNKRMAI